ncbi:SCO family protein [Metapseudomonas furukawaii]|uniref:SCO family protein n=1 Tax=Metapseudomonas furukawaii TaxID=1149133 RepID=UPI00227C1297|nr:SCO family protein [Pseudomonas furukawaii]WAG81327.1 SCO family protein [Pseudomonas furukawaii]
MSRRSAFALIGIIALVLLGTQVGYRRPAEAPAPAAAWDGRYFPNIPLTSHDGRQLRFYDDLIAGKVVLVNFIFTSCGDTCPLETARLRQVQKILGQRVGRDIHFYSISIDPLHDTPEVLRAYAERFQVGPGWLFLTGDQDQINGLRERMGLLAQGDDPAVLKQHNLSLIVGNQATGQWMKVSPFENPWILADKLANSLRNWQDAAEPGRDYAKAPAIRPPSSGEQLFRTRCSACHSLGAQPGELASLRSLGPDLAGVTRQRDRAWLARWIREPDRLLAEKDPLAISLYERYDRVAMPNLRLAEADVEALLAYLEGAEEGARPVSAP